MQNIKKEKDQTQNPSLEPKASTIQIYGMVNLPIYKEFLNTVNFIGGNGPTIHIQIQMTILVGNVAKSFQEYFQYIIFHLL